MYVIPRDKVQEILPAAQEGWEVQLSEGRFVAQVVILFEETAHIAEAHWVSLLHEPIPTYVRVESEHE